MMGVALRSCLDRALERGVYFVGVREMWEAGAIGDRDFRTSDWFRLEIFSLNSIFVDDSLVRLNLCLN